MRTGEKHEKNLRAEHNLIRCTAYVDAKAAGSQPVTA